LQWQNFAFRRSNLRPAEIRSFSHDSATSFEQVAASIGSLDLVANRVREGHLGNLGRKICLLGRPVPEARSETMHGQIAATHPTQQHKKCHIAERSAGISSRKNELLGDTRNIVCCLLVLLR
jgi:hypothetical protein